MRNKQELGIYKFYRTDFIKVGSIIKYHCDNLEYLNSNDEYEADFFNTFEKEVKNNLQ